VTNLRESDRIVEVNHPERVQSGGIRETAAAREGWGGRSKPPESVLTTIEGNLASH
jgi:hypothetical protein